MSSEVDAVRVHLASSDVALTPPPQKERRKVSTFHTVMLDSTNPIQDLLSQEENRCEAWIIPSAGGTGKDIVICHSQSNANAVNGKADFTEGAAGTIIPGTITSPVPCHTTDRVFVTSNSTVTAAGITVGVIEILYAED